MRQFFIISFLFLLQSENYLNAQAPDGAYKIVEAQYGNAVMTKEEIRKENIIKIFKDGYWISTFLVIHNSHSMARAEAPTRSETANMLKPLIFIPGIVRQLAIQPFLILK